ncbi:MAG TPA: endolytic transglycosylase MltG [Gemmatimonas sp.]|nr:endolytic transglycosylase MltG [Gemmatimonas sp.]
MARRRGRTLSRLVIGALALVAIAGFWLNRQIGDSGASTEKVTVVIPRGATVRTVSDSLVSTGIITSPRAFRFYASLGNKDRAIKPGQYEFVRGQGWSSVLATLVKGRGASRTVVVPEGFDIRAIAPLLAKALGVPEDSVRAAAADAEWRRKLDVPAETLEGYLFPATYTFSVGTTAREAVTAMLERFETVWKPEWNARLTALGITRHEAMTMASIVEKEARKAEERPIISAVYWNRVKIRMPLQADPTVQYALPAHTERVLYRDLEVDSPYNTYRNAGLPPGPIASPGEASIAAALAPANVPYLYFVAHPDGHHEFRTTFAEHERAIAEVRRAAREAARESARAASGRPAARAK